MDQPCVLPHPLALCSCSLSTFSPICARVGRSVSKKVRLALAAEPAQGFEPSSRAGAATHRPLAPVCAPSAQPWTHLIPSAWSSATRVEVPEKTLASNFPGSPLRDRGPAPASDPLLPRVRHLNWVPLRKGDPMPEQYLPVAGLAAVAALPGHGPALQQGDQREKEGIRGTLPWGTLGAAGISEPGPSLETAPDPLWEALLEETAVPTTAAAVRSLEEASGLLFYPAQFFLDMFVRIQDATGLPWWAALCVGALGGPLPSSLVPPAPYMRHLSSWHSLIPGPPTWSLTRGVSHLITSLIPGVPPLGPSHRVSVNLPEFPSFIIPLALVPPLGLSHRVSLFLPFPHFWRRVNHDGSPRGSSVPVHVIPSFFHPWFPHV